MFVGTYSATEIEADDKYRLLGGNDGTVIANVSETGAPDKPCGGLCRC